MIDFDKLLNTPIISAFGEQFRVVTTKGTTISLTGIFDIPTLLVDAGGFAQVSTANPTLFIKLKDYKKQIPTEGDIITRRSTKKTYKINSVDIDAVEQTASIQLWEITEN